MKKKTLLLFIALFASCASAAPPTYAETCNVASFATEGADVTLWISLAFMLTSAMIAAAYMYSKAREDPRTEVWAKDEAFNLIISVFLFIGLLLFFTGACSVAYDYAGENPFAASRNYLNGLLRANGVNMLRELTYGSISDQLSATWYLYTGIPPVYGTGLAGKANMRAFSAQKEFLIDLYLPAVASLTAQLYLIDAIQWVGAYVLLPFGFVMRLVPFTRDFGNIFIALFFGLYIIVPTMFAMSAGVFREITSRPIPECAECSVEMFYSYRIDPGGATSVNTVFYRIGSTLPQAIFIPNLILIVTVTCVMAIWKALRATAV
ncbi:Uncharacterised protein [uncultured archaeon]|nr:Uncharacterised protein [uncultured archaeon]